MVSYAIIETEVGLTVTEMGPGMSPEEAAEREGGIVADPGPYDSFDEATEALTALADEDDEEDAPQ